MVPLLGAPWWGTLACAVAVVLVLQLARTQWMLMRRSAPLLPLLDALVPYGRGLSSGEGRSFERIGGDTDVVCLAGRRSSSLSFIRSSEEEVRAFTDHAPNEHVRLVSDQIVITGPVAFQYSVVDSTDSADPLRTDSLSLVQRWSMVRMGAKTGVMVPSSDDVKALLHHLENSDFVRDIKPRRSDGNN
ncbi:hypothetical protein GCM10010331_44600 [Streptomyces xanthochromogenes]|nr:hypothetical protein GCM10010331_44600 [Streptomyces xanthochromogenes]